jgi:hypothetical protein
MTADTLYDLLAELRGNGGDHEWRGDWYPVTLIRDSYFTEYAQSFAEDIGHQRHGIRLAVHLHRLGARGARASNGLHQRRIRRRHLLVPLEKPTKQGRAKKWIR